MKDSEHKPTISPAPERHHGAMRPLGPAATKIFLALIAGLHAGDARKLDNAPGAFMAVSVDNLAVTGAGSLYAIAHRYEVNGDLVPDPDVEFYAVDDSLRPDGKAVYPTAIDHGTLGYRRYVDFDASGHPARIASRAQASLAQFCDGWMRNIADQQRLVLS
jgi:hypothetical protein